MNNLSTKKVIAITLNSLWNIANFRIPLIKDICQAGYKVILFAPKDTDPSKIVDLGYEYVELKQLVRDGRNPLQDIRLVNELQTLYKKHKVDLAVHFTIKPNIYGTIAAYRLAIPSIAVVTGLGYTFLSNGLSNKIAKRLYRYAFKRSHKVIFQNHDDQQLFIQINLVEAKRTQVILGSGIDTSLFQSAKKPSNSKQQVIFIGRLLNDKGVRELLEGFSKVEKDITLHIVGDVDNSNPASLTEEDIQQIDNPNVVMHGFQDNVRPFISNADVVILPSYREGLPRTMLEAMAMNKPIIATDVPGCREVVEHRENGFLISSHNSEAIKEAIEEFFALSDKEKLEMGTRSRQLAEEKFSCEVINNQYISLIDEILTN